MNSYFKNNVFSISFGTGLSKLIGFTREAFIAAAFGIGITYDVGSEMCIRDRYTLMQVF